MFVSEANSGAAAAAAVHLLSVAYSKSRLSFPSVVVSLSPAFFAHTTSYNSACVDSSPQAAGFIQRASRGNDDAATAIINVGN